jgi:ssDNA-binding Zn-finger/Zn-ribbon topoisomerase 1
MVEKKSKEFVGVIFKCCNVYSRIYINAKGTAFIGKCPKCGAKLEAKISKEGSSHRFFIAD